MWPAAVDGDELPLRGVEGSLCAEGEVVLGSCGEGKEMVKRRGEGKSVVAG